MAVQVETSESIELALLLEAIHRRYGFDFRDYSADPLRRRLHRRARAEHVESLSELQGLLLRDPGCMERLLGDLSVNVTAMFRDPSFFAALRRTVVPILRMRRFARIWCAGCSTGEEVYSLAIVLREEGLYDRVRIYATDLNEYALEAAAAGVVPLGRMQEYTDNYIRSGGRREFSAYYVAAYDAARFNRDLIGNVVFAQHNLASDRAFAEFDLIFCRNVLIYFETGLQNRVTELFCDSLRPFGVLGLGSRETIAHSPVAGRFAPLAPRDRIYRKAA
ncbi:MAG: protein-glutamate O-methyltransferase CheR [Acidobacteriota bacterium]|nr:protein-glutamate O-methyltransferase CheR [Acidobacteriota bacterium]MDE3190335.1 protein-glutamate O-methyltransferase CheR [Acidobacteriota bacterium]